MRSLHYYTRLSAWTERPGQMSEFVLVLFQDDIAGRFPWPYQPQVPPVSKTLTVSQADWATRRALVS